jgi:hypothetical protein
MPLRWKTKQRLLLVSLALTGCATPPVVATPHPLMIYATPATTPWLGRLYDCARATAAVPILTSPEVADVLLRIGDPPISSVSAVQIDTVDILVVTHQSSPLGHLSADEAEALFSDTGDESVHLWVFPAEDDVQQVFRTTVMRGREVSPLARIAASPQQMVDLLKSDPTAVGILTSRWMVAGLQGLTTVATVPVLAISPKSSLGTSSGVLACLQ